MEITPTVTKESSGLVSVKSELSMMVVKENKDDEFYCEVTYLVPGETRMTETNRINITIYCESLSFSTHHKIQQINPCSVHDYLIYLQGAI